MRVENSIKIVKVSLISQIITTILGFVNRIVFIRFLGEEYLGFSGLFTSILNMLALTELGLGSAIVYNLYKPVYDKDEEKIAALTNFYKTIYLLLALLIFTLGMCFLPFLQFFIKDIKELSFSIGYIRLIYLLSLLETVASYLFVYRTTLLTVSQRGYIIKTVNIISNIALSVVRLIILLLTRNYILYLLFGLLIKVISNAISSQYTLKFFPYLKKKIYKKKRVDRETRLSILSNSANLSIHTFAAYIVNSTDNLLISSFVGITTLGLYSNYNLIFSTIKSFISSFVDSIQAPLGDLVASGNKTRVREVLDITTHTFYLICSFCSVSLAILSSDFVLMIFGENFVMNFSMVIVCSLNLFIWTMTRSVWKLSLVTGFFKDDRINAIIEAVTNAVVSVIAVQFWGITGIFFGTTISYLVAFILKTKLQFNKYFNISCGGYFIKIIQYLIVFSIELILTFLCGYFVQSKIESFYICFIFKSGICVLIPNFINWLVYRNCDINRYCVDLIKNKVFKTKVKREYK